MLASVVDYTRDIRPEVSRRYLALLLDGLRAEGRPRTELPGPALETEEVSRGDVALEGSTALTRAVAWRAGH